MAENQVAKLRIPHHAILDLMLANPFMTQNDIAKEAGYSVSWLSVLVNSDSFKSELNKRRTELNEVLAVEIQTDVTANLRSLALGGINKTKELIANSINLEQVTSATESALKLLGYGEQKKPQDPSNVTYNIDARQMSPALINARQNFGRPLVTIENGEQNDVLPAPERELEQITQDCPASRPAGLDEKVAYYK
jgi:hypothetical protein